MYLITNTSYKVNMNFIQYDNKKLTQDSVELRKIVKELEDNIYRLVEIEEDSLLVNIVERQSAIIGDLNKECTRLSRICMELDYIIGCVERSVSNYVKCEGKVSDLLEKVKLIGEV